MAHRVLSTILVAVLALPAPVFAAPGQTDRLRAAHEAGLRYRKARAHLQAADQWLAALATLTPSREVEADVQNHFCEAVQSLTDAQGDADQRGGVAERLDEHRARLTSGATWLEEHVAPNDMGTCLAQWRALAERYTPAAGEPPAEPVTTPPPPTPSRDAAPDTTTREGPAPGPSPAPPPHKSGLGARVGLGVSASLLVAAGATVIGLDQRLRELDRQGDTAEARGDEPEYTRLGERHQRTVTGAVVIGVLGVAALAGTIAFAVLTARHNKGRAGRVALAAGGLTLRF